MYSEALKQLIDAALTDGVITEQERQVIKKKAMSENIDPDEIDVYLDSEIQKINIKKQQSTGIIKCPACGEVIPPLTGICPSCGHTISFSKIKSPEISLMELKTQLDDLYLRYSKKKVTFIDILLTGLTPFGTWIFYIFWKIGKSKDLYAEFDNVISNTILLYGQNNNAQYYLTEIKNKFESAHKKNNVMKIVSYVILFINIILLIISYSN